MHRMIRPLGTAFCLVLGLAATAAVRADRVAQPAVVAQARVVLQQSPSTAGGAAPSAAVLSKYCITCHNTKRKTAGLAIDALDLQRVGDDAEAWEKIARKFRTHEMPP